MKILLDRDITLADLHESIRFTPSITKSLKIITFKVI